LLLRRYEVLRDRPDGSKKGQAGGTGRPR
jgi:hypothetical protein